MSPAALTDRLARFATTHAAASAGDGVRVLKQTRVTVVRSGGVVVKAHPEGTGEAALNARLRVARTLPGILLPPLTERAERVGGRLVTMWPAGEPVDPADPDAAPWEAAAELLARLHAVPSTGLPLPPAGGPSRLLESVTHLSRLGGPESPLDGSYTGAVDVIQAAFGTLPRDLIGTVPSDSFGRPPGDLSGTPPRDLSGAGREVYVSSSGPVGGRVTHGDWHLGQIVRYKGEWLLIDVDDLGDGLTAWDLARPAAWYATGFLAPGLWERFLTAYLRAGGAAVSPEDPWRELDVPARALTVQLAATAVAAAHTEGRPLDDVEQDLVSSCGRIISAAAATAGSPQTT